MKEKSFERKTELLEAALFEFTKENYENASLNSIIKNAGISKGTFYYHFQDKQALYLYLLESCARTKFDFIDEKMKERVSGGSNTGDENSCARLDIFESFKLQARLGAEFAAKYPDYHRLSRMFLKEKGNQIYVTAMDILGNSTESILEEMVKGAIRNGDFRSDVPDGFIMKTVSYLFTHFDEIFSSDDDLELKQMLKNLDNFVDFLKNGLGS